MGQSKYLKYGEEIMFYHCKTEMADLSDSWSCLSFRLTGDGDTLFIDFR